MVTRLRRLAVAAVFLCAAAGCNFSLDDYPYCFACQSERQCPDYGDAGPPMVCGSDGFCHYQCQIDADCASRGAICDEKHFCHAVDGGGC